MRLKIISPFLLIFAFGVSFAQLGVSPEKAVRRHMEKHRWEKALTRLQKALRKDTLNPSVRYLFSGFYFHPDNPGYNLDSAYHYVVGAIDDYRLLSARERDKLRRMPLDSMVLVTWREKIDSTAFEKARNTNTEAGYLEFLTHHTLAPQRALASELRDEVAYQDALRTDTYQAFEGFLERYPGAKRAAEARAHYDRLLYEEMTRDQRLRSYEKFLESHPATPYVNEVHRHIFEISTAGGGVDSFLRFIARYPSSGQVRKARQLAFHILADEENPQWPRRFLNDSLQHLYAIQRTYLVPILKNGKFGFIDEHGEEIIAPAFSTIDPRYTCGHVTDEVLVLDHKVVARNGSVIYGGHADEAIELGIGFLKVVSGDVTRVVHKAGFVFADSVLDARVVDRRFIALRRKMGWSLLSLTGRAVDKRVWDDIQSIDRLLVFSQAKKVFLAAGKQLDRVSEGLALELSEPFDEVRKWPRGLVWVRSGAFQGVLDQDLKTVMRFDRHVLEQAPFGATATGSHGKSLFNWTGREASPFRDIRISGSWVVVQRQASWFLFEPQLLEMNSRPYDTIRTEGPFIIGMLTDTVYVHFGQNRVRQFIQPSQITFIPGMDTTSFLSVEDKDHVKTIFDLNGQKLFSAQFNGIEYAGHGMFIVLTKERKGLVNAAGETLLPAEFDAIGSVKEGVVSLLKSKRFGGYHIARKQFIKPQYDRNLVPYADQIVVIFRDGRYGFSGWDNKPLSAFEFDEVRYWDDTVALVRKGPLWNFYDILERQMTESNLRQVTMIRQAPGEKIAIIQKGGDYGVISSTRNVVIPVSFTDIMNVGSADAPLYFTEKHIREASLFVVIYYDRFGKMIRKEVYDDAADYDRIYCSDQ